MKKINPITILFISLITVFISLILLKQSNIDLKGQNEILKETKIIANEYSSLKRSWNDPKNVTKTVDKIIKQLKLKTLVMDDNKKKITITIKNGSYKTIDKFINKILNANLIILKLNIKKDSLYLEIGK